MGILSGGVTSSGRHFRRAALAAMLRLENGGQSWHGETCCAVTMTRGRPLMA